MSDETCCIRISLADPAARAGHPVRLAIEVANAGRAALELPRWSAWFDQQFEISGPSGRELRRTAFGDDEFKRAGVTALAPLVLPAGSTCRSEVLVSRLFDMSLAGAYRVAVSRDVRDPDGGEWLTARSAVLEFVLGE